MMRTNQILATLITLGLLVSAGISTSADDQPRGAKIRIGTYDSRAIAYAPSPFNPTAEKKLALDKAKAARDQAKIKELEMWGVQHQRQLHFQGFGRVPVDQLLEPVKAQIAEIAREKQLAAMTMNCDYTSEQIELVDVTDDLVKLSDPSEKTL